MNPKARAVYNEVLEHWEDILRRAKADLLLPIGPDDCAWCRLFNSLKSRSDDCIGCPIYERTGKQYCYGTPYWAVDDAYDAVRYASGTKAKLCRAIREQLALIRSLLPKTVT